MSERRVLVVDDEPDERGLLVTHLSRAGLVPVEAVDAEEALDALAPDLVAAFVDLRLPGMGGWELITILRERLPALPVVVTSVLDAHDYPSTEAVLPKPYTAAQVHAVLAHLLGDGAR